MRKLLCTCAVVFSFSPFAQAAPGREAASFLDIPVGGGPAALASAYTALATDAYAPVYNPGGLGFVDSTQIAAQHLSYLESIHYEFLSLVRPINNTNAWGASAQYLGSGDIAGTNGSGDSTGNYSTHFAAYSLAYSHRFKEKLAVGFSGKLIDAKIADASAHAYAVDIGGLYKVTDRFNLAAALTNAGTKLKFLSDGGALPLTFKCGGAYQPSRQWKMVAEGDYAGYGLLSGRTGVEWKPLELVAIRAGYRTDTTKELGMIAGLTTGVGLDLWGQELSYAWVPYGDLGTTQYFSMLIRFGGREEERRNLIQYRNIKTHKLVKNQRDDSGDKLEYEQLMQLLDVGDVYEEYTKKVVRGQISQ